MEEKLTAVGEELIVVKQLPIIEDKLDEALENVKDRLNAMSGLAVTEDNYKDLKKVRSDLNKEFDNLEKLRKNVKAAVEAPYKKFEQGAYKRIADEYQKAITELDGNIKAVEGSLISQRKEELREYWDDYRLSLGIDEEFADARRSGIKVGLSGSMKSLKEQARTYLDRVAADLKMIDTLEDRDEVLVEYRVLMNVSEAMLVVKRHHDRIEEERKRRESIEEAIRIKKEQEEAVNAALANAEKAEGEDVPLNVPTVEVPQEIFYNTVFRVYGTLDMLRALKQFLMDGNYKFETLKEDK